MDKAYIFLELQLSSLPTITIDSLEILRAEIAMSLSALDCFIHDLVRIGMIECFELSRVTRSQSYLSYGVSLNTLEQILAASDAIQKTAILDNEIRRQNGFKTFQDPESIAKALSHLGIDKIWENVGSDLGLDSRTVKEKLVDICKWRNRIVHESDIDGSYGYAGIKHPIDRASVLDVVNFIDKICNSIYKHVKL